MALNRYMHPRNRYKDNKPDFTKLAEKYPDFASHVSVNIAGNASLDFHDPESLRSLTCTLLKEDFGLDIELPLDRLIPTVPLRLNYIHWIEDLLQEAGYGINPDIWGIDIGCGASCIYPMLGCHMNGWHFVTSEVDELSLQYAKDNVTRNNFQKNITVLPSTRDALIQAVVKASPSQQSVYHFTMCNPPFFGNLMEAQGIMSRTMDRAEPKSISTASEVEMIFEAGGEVDFVKRMIMESLQLQEQVVWYTSMVGKKSSIGALKEELSKHKIRNVTTAEFCQGRTMRWGIAWSFHDDIKVLPPSKRKKDKQRPPLVIPVPDRFVTKAVEALRNHPSGSSKGQPEKIRAVAHAAREILNDLQITFVVQPSSRKIVKLECTAHRNTWANQRRRRRQRARLKQGGVLDSKPPTISKDSNQNVAETKATHFCADNSLADEVVKSDTDLAIASDPVMLDDGRVRSDCEYHQLRLEGTSEGVLDSDRHISEVLNACGVTPSSLDPISRHSSAGPSHSWEHADGAKQNSQETQMNTSVHQNIDQSQGAQMNTSVHMNTQGLLMNASVHPNTSKSQGTQMNTSVPPSTNKPEEALFRCSLMVTASAEGKANLELIMSWLDGTSREAMHQVGQYMKNKFNR